MSSIYETEELKFLFRACSHVPILEPYPYPTKRCVNRVPTLISGNGLYFEGKPCACKLGNRERPHRKAPDIFSCAATLTLTCDGVWPQVSAAEARMHGRSTR